MSETLKLYRVQKSKPFRFDSSPPESDRSLSCFLCIVVSLFCHLYGLSILAGSSMIA